MAAKITDTWLKGLRASSRRQEYRDDGCPHLFVVVQPLGARPRARPTVAFQYRVGIGSRDHKRSLGRYPAVTYADARAAAWELTREIDAGRNPFAAAAPSAAARTVKEAFDRYMEREGGSRKSAEEKRAIFNRELRAIQARPILDVTRAELLRIVAAKDDDYPQAARKLLAITKRFFEWCATKGEDYTGLQVNPAATITPMSDAVRRDRGLDDTELHWLLCSLPSAGAVIRRSGDMVSDEFPVIYELLLRTLLRKEEVFNLRRSMVVRAKSGDAEKIVLPDSKGNRPFAVWLHPSAACLLRGRLDGPHDERVFRARPNERPLRRVRASMDALATKAGRGIEHWSLHDFRQSGNDALAAMLDKHDRPLVPSFIRDRLLNHADPSVRGQSYESHHYYHERKRALERWNNHLDSLMDAPKLLKAA